MDGDDALLLRPVRGLTVEPDLSAVPSMADGRPAAAHIADVEKLSVLRRTTMPHGGHMAWRVWEADPDRPILLLFHGGGGSWLHWVRNVLPLSRRFTVMAADLPGLGESDPPDDLKDIWSVARGVAAGIEQVVPAGRSYDICGFSFGAMVGAHVSTLVDRRLRSVTLGGPGGLELSEKPWAPPVPMRADMGPEELVAAARRNLEILMLADPAEVDGVAIHSQITGVLRARTKSRHMSRTWTLSKCLPRVTTKLHAIWGELDVTAHPYMHEREALLRRYQADIKFRVIPGAGHWACYEKADRFNETLVGLIGGK